MGKRLNVSRFIEPTAPRSLYELCLYKATQVRGDILDALLQQWCLIPSPLLRIPRDLYAFFRVSFDIHTSDLQFQFRVLPQSLCEFDLETIKTHGGYNPAKIKVQIRPPFEKPHVTLTFPFVPGWDDLEHHLLHTLQKIPPFHYLVSQEVHVYLTLVGRFVYGHGDSVYGIKEGLNKVVCISRKQGQLCVSLAPLAKKEARSQLKFLRDHGEQWARQSGSPIYQSMYEHVMQSNQSLTCDFYQCYQTNMFI